MRINNFKHLLLHCCLFILSLAASAQQEQVEKRADSLYFAKAYQAAAITYLEAARLLPLFSNPKSYHYNAACCYVLAGDHKKGIAQLRIAVNTYGYNKLTQMLADKDLDALHNTKAWKKIITALREKETKLADPANMQLVTTDIHHFWKAYDAARKDTAHRKDIFTREYFGKASVGLKDYFATKILTVDAFVRNQDKKPLFYPSIRQNTLAIDGMKGEILQNMKKLDSLYDDAVFPAIYFVMGRWNSAGTVSDNGMLIGVDQLVKGPGVEVGELSLWETNNFQTLSKLPVIVTHELIHSQQTKMRQDTSLLHYAIIEGMADFLCELITGANPSSRQQLYAQNRRKEIWAEFEQEMYLSRAYNWIANSKQETADRPADLGYHVGYEICKAYYEHAIDKKQAIKDMLTITDYKAFLNNSGYAAKVARQ